jgi:hypothetical protein
MSKFVLGPYLDSVTEPDPNALPAPPPAPAPGLVGIKDPIATEPGGKVNVEILPPATPADVRPVRIHAMFITPPSAVPPKEQRTVAWFQTPSADPAVRKVGGSVDVAADATKLQVAVAQVVPGVHFVQTILEYPD